MRQKISLSTVELAVQEIPGFGEVVRKFDQQVILNGQSQSTYKNYLRCIAALSLHFGRLPEQLSEDDINGYLTGLVRRTNVPSRSNFKHIVYGLRYYYRVQKLNERALALPSLKDESKLPVILNRSELKELFKMPKQLKHRILLTLIYSAGLRAHEAINLKIGDIDFERQTIHIKQSKFNKDRIVPLSPLMSIGLKRYMAAEHPSVYLFNGKEPDGRYSVKGISWVMRESLKKTSITKDVCLHSLRHAYATHLLEDGVNIVTLKNLLGHADVSSTMVYLHVAQCDTIKAHSPLDSLYAKQAK